MKDRIKELVNAVPETGVFGDVGCDHGLVALEMLRQNKCSVAFASDVSEKCLLKAKKILKNYEKIGRAICILSDGFENLPHLDTALIAGLGGEEMISILKDAKELPENLVLQPMKNADKVRVFVVKAGYKIIKDYVFLSGGKFYNLISLKKGEDALTKEEIEFGRTNINEPSEDFKKMIGAEIKKLYAFAENAPREKKKEFIEKAEKLKKYV